MSAEAQPNGEVPWHAGGGLIADQARGERIIEDSVGADNLRGRVLSFFTSISERLHHGIPADQMRSPFEPFAKPVYVILGVESVAAAVLLFFTGFTISPAAILAIPLWALGLCVSAMLLRRYGHSRLTGGMESVALIYGQGIIALFLIFPLVALSGPFADGRLADADRTLGFDWVAFASLAAARPGIQWAFVIAYHSFTWQPLLILTLLFAKGCRSRAWALVLAGSLAAFATALIFPFAPAEGAFVHFRMNTALFPDIASPWQVAPVLRQIKEGDRYITPRLFAGLVSFPSYHAAAAATFSWAMWPFRRARWWFLLLNICMCFSAMIVGAHYLVDILAGVLVGLAASEVASVVVAPR